ncbi:hypothetical protein [Spirilliplanes yamanashiensis]|uniref:Uncharacterized protein n=1 Tax=Spirilliplanes yamanashiensis TaxID=42233 RepID=A0A8J3Y9I8_9ACTN|nr:hypothetical protein [Spirilliplanes yamanashiensis]MDP9815443.1 hypothetical protein [Spirilliplanes yamanashiensis]GIJ03698.1 hypothetical protein Sya03_30500 [Spirilliplanes yamanashiensis]
MTQHINAEGVPLRGDGTPFPSDPAQWSDEEREYLETYFFNGELETGIEHEQIAMVDVPEQAGDGEAYA